MSSTGEIPYWKLQIGHAIADDPKVGIEVRLTRAAGQSSASGPANG